MGAISRAVQAESRPADPGTRPCCGAATPSGATMAAASAASAASAAAARRRLAGDTAALFTTPSPFFRQYDRAGTALAEVDAADLEGDPAAGDDADVPREAARDRRDPVLCLRHDAHDPPAGAVAHEVAASAW